MVIALAVAVAIVWKRRQEEVVVTVSRNEEYGTYEYGADYSTVTDANDYYAAGGDTEEEEGTRTTDRNSQYGS